MPGSSTPVGLHSRSFRIQLLPSAATKASAPTITNFGAQSPWPTDSLSTLNRERRRAQSKTRFRVETNLTRVGLAPTGNQCTVSVNHPPCRSTFPAPELCSAHRSVGCRSAADCYVNYFASSTDSSISGAVANTIFAPGASFACPLHISESLVSVPDLA